MAPKTTVEKINNRLVSTTDSSYQDVRTCLASYKMFAKSQRRCDAVLQKRRYTSIHGSP